MTDKEELLTVVSQGKITFSYSVNLGRRPTQDEIDTARYRWLSLAAEIVHHQVLVDRLQSLPRWDIMSGIASMDENYSGLPNSTRTHSKTVAERDTNVYLRMEIDMGTERWTSQRVPVAPGDLFRVTARGIERVKDNAQH